LSQTNIDHGQARGILAAAIATSKTVGYIPKHPKYRKIAEVMLGRHLTYRYVLLTNLLAKATNGAANALAMQAGADLIGAFDSRALCHNVVVDFDRDPGQLAGKLGRSNEPYLNKPARYPALSTENAVRRGYDKGILEKCIDILANLTGQTDARVALEDAVYYTMQRESLVATAAEFESDATLHKVLARFASAVTTRSNEGESCAVLTGLAFYILGRGHGHDYQIRVHPVNQAGTSSREILDVDVYLATELQYAVEVKDKVFTANDVDHAASKARAGGLESFFFVCGPQSNGAVAGNRFIDEIANKGVKVSFVDIGQLFLTALGFAPGDLRADEVWEFIDTAMNAARVKDDTRKHIINCASDAGLVSGNGELSTLHLTQGF
jgi:hypothetical protein